MAPNTILPAGNLLVFLAMLLGALAVACTNESGGDVSRGEDGNVTPVAVNEAEVRDTVAGFLKASFSGDEAIVRTYLSADCDTDIALEAVRRLGSEFGGEDVQIEVGEVVFETTGPRRVHVTDLPGAQILVGGRPLAGAEQGANIRLVHETDVWRIENCGDIFFAQ